MSTGKCWAIAEVVLATAGETLTSYRLVALSFSSVSTRSAQMGSLTPSPKVCVLACCQYAQVGKDVLILPNKLGDVAAAARWMEVGYLVAC